jgi:hypothetical protein
MVASSACIKNAIAAIHGKPAILRAERIIENPSIGGAGKQHYQKRIALQLQAMTLICASYEAILAINWSYNDCF